MPLTDTVAGAMGGVYQTKPTQSQVQTPTEYKLPNPNVKDKLVTEEEWDYRTAELSPDGEPLPPGAVGWRPDGSPDFGTGIKAWQTKVKYEMATSWKKGWKEGERIAEEAGYKGDTMARLISAKNLAGSAFWNGLAEPVLNALSLPAQWTEQVGGTVGYALKDMIYEKKDFDEIDWKSNWEASRLAYSEVLNPFFGKGSNLREKFIERMNAGEDPAMIAEALQISGDANAFMEIGGQLIFDPLNAIGKVGKVKQAAKYAKIAKAELATVEAADATADLFKAANAADSLDAARGIDKLHDTLKATSDLAAEGIEALAKPGKPTAQVVDRLKKLIQYTPESRANIMSNRTGIVFESWMTALGNNPNKMDEVLTAVVDFRSADKGRSMAGMKALLDSGISPNLLFSPAGNDAMVIIEKMMTQHGGGLKAAFGLERKLSTAVAKASTEFKTVEGVRASVESLAKRSAELDELVTTVAKGQELNPLYKAGTGQAKTQQLSGLVKEIQKIVSGLTDSQIKTLASKDAKLAKMIDQAEALAKSPLTNTGEKAAYLIRMMGKTVDDLFPSAKRILEAEELVKAGKGGVQAQELAKLGESLRPHERAIAKLHNTLQDKAVGPINKFYAKLYLGLSPGYAFRNWTQNSFQMWLDYGPDLLGGGSADDVWAIATKFNGGFAVNAGEKYGVASIDKYTNAFESTDFWTGVKKMFNPKGAKGFDVRGLSETFEASASRRIVGKMYVKTFSDAIDPLAKSITKDARFKDLDPKLLRTAIMEARGDVQQAIKFLKEGTADGFIRPFSIFDNLPKPMREYISEAGIQQEFEERVLKAGSRDEAVAEINRIFDAIDQKYISALGDGRAMDLEHPVESALAVGVDDGVISHASARIKGQLIQATDDAVKGMQDILKKAAQEIRDPLAFQKYTETIAPLSGWTNKLQDARTATNSAVDIIKDRQLGEHLAESWKKLRQVLNIPADVPAPQTVDEFIRIGWQQQQRFTTELYAVDLKATIGKAKQFLTEMGVTKYDAEVDTILETFEKYQNLAVAEGGVLVQETLTGPRVGQITSLAKKYGIASVTEKGVPLDQHLLNILNKYSGMDEPFLSLNDEISVEMAERAFKEYAKKHGMKFEEVATEAVSKIPDNVRMPLIGSSQQPTKARLMKLNLETTRTNMLKYAEGTFDKMQVTKGALAEEDFAELEKMLGQRIGEIRAVSSRVSQMHRDFTLLNYGEQTYRGVLASYMFPYYKWYAGTYGNYAERVIRNPAIISHYYMLKDAMAKAHSDLPEWWRYNLSTDDLPEPIQNAVAGVEKFFGMEEQPLFLNIEALLWPLQGITGTNFDDPEKVTNWWTYALDQIGKQGPSMWTPFSIAAGLTLKAQGQDDAAGRWLGRFMSQTALVKSATGVEIDPFVRLFEGGTDPYEDGRARRALGEMMLNNPDPEFQAQAIDAARSHSGPLWEQAVREAGKQRNMGNVLSFMFGVGLKARTQDDLELDKFYTEYGKIMQMRPNMSPEDFRNQMALLGEKYPFMDAVLIGNKTDDKRDAAFAYNVLSRIPPGDMSGLLEFVGVRQDTIDYFFNNKGDLSKMSEDDRLRFNASMLSLAAIYKMPSTATKQEWNTAKFQYNETMKRAGLIDANGEETPLGAKLQVYYALMDDDRRKANDYIKANPDIQRALDIKNAYVANNPILNAYYGGIETIEKYFQSQVRTEMIKKYGEDVYQKWDFYNNMLDSKAKAAYLKANPDLKGFKEERGKWQEYVNRKTSELAAKMPEGKAPEFRPAQTATQETLQGMTMQGQRNVTSQELLQQMTPELQQMVQLYAQGQELPYSALQQLEYLGGYYGLSGNEVLQVILSGQ